MPRLITGQPDQCKFLNFFVRRLRPTPPRWDPRPDPLGQLLRPPLQSRPSHRILYPGISFITPGRDVHSHTGGTRYRSGQSPSHATILRMIIRNAASTAVFSREKMGKATLASTDLLFAGLNAFEPGHEHRLHTHKGQDKFYLVLEGEGEVTVGTQRSRIKPGDFVLARSGEEHGLRNPGPGRLIVLVAMAPPPTAA